MTDYRFTLTPGSAATAARNRGYDDALKGQPASPPDAGVVGEKVRSAYWQGFRRGRERRQANAAA